MRINYTYKEMGRQIMILDIGAPYSIAGVSWMTQYLKEFGLTIDQMKSTKCNQPFVFGSFPVLETDTPKMVLHNQWKGQCS